MQLVLASASPARLATLRAAGVEPVVQVSQVDEPATIAAAEAAGERLGAAEHALRLARAKCADVAPRVASGAIVLGCDSVLEFDGAILGKPVGADDARARWRAMRGRSGVLHSGHWLIDRRTPQPDPGFGATGSTRVHFADLDDAEIDAYVATGEPLHVAGAFTIDGLAGPYVTRIEGDAHNVVGVSLPLLRELLGRLGVPWRDLRAQS